MLATLVQDKTRSALLAAAILLLPVPGFAQTYSEPPLFSEKVSKKELPPVAEPRLPHPARLADRRLRPWRRPLPRHPLAAR